MVRYGRVDLYGVRVVFMIALLSLIYNSISEPPSYGGIIVNVVICVLCLFAKQIATEFYGTNNINFIY